MPTSVSATTGARANVAPSFLDLADPGDRVVSTNTFSKSWLMTGWRLGWIAAPRELIADLAKLVEYNTSCAPPFVQRAGVVAVTRGEQVIARTVLRLREARDASACIAVGDCRASRRWRRPARCTRSSAWRISPTASTSASVSSPRPAWASPRASRSAPRARVSSAGASRRARRVSPTASIACDDSWRVPQGAT